MNYVSLTSIMGINGTIAGDELRARCPMHQDTNPSFSMNIHTGLWTCFSRCGSGNFTQLVEKVMGMEPREAWEWVNSEGKRVGIERLSDQLNRELGLIPAEESTSVDQQDWKQAFNDMSEKAMPLWFLTRGFTWDTINHWNIRYDGLWDSITIPLLWDGQLAGTITRHTHPDKPKYENSHGMTRANMLFGEISQAAKEIIICEGPLDAIWLWQLGYNAVGLLGNRMSQRQAELLKQHRFGEVVLALDNDEAGIEGTKHNFELLLKNGWLLPQISKINWPANRKDPQDCDRHEFNELFVNRQPIIHLLTGV